MLLENGYIIEENGAKFDNKEAKTRITRVSLTTDDGGLREHGSHAKEPTRHGWERRKRKAIFYEDNCQ